MLKKACVGAMHGHSSVQTEADLWRGQQLEACGTVSGFGFTEHQPFGPDRGRRPCDGSELSHGGLSTARPP
jgi:hypothetical protein